VSVVSSQKRGKRRSKKMGAKGRRGPKERKGIKAKREKICDLYKEEENGGIRWVVI
jgi:hypothetical protein